MICKTFEVRDTSTFVPILALQLSPTNAADQYLLARAGFGFSKEAQGDYIAVIQIDGGCGLFTTDPFDWATPGNRTLQFAHTYLQNHFGELESGSVLDVEFLVGKTTEPKKSESENDPLFCETKA